MGMVEEDLGSLKVEGGGDDVLGRGASQQAPEPDGGTSGQYQTLGLLMYQQGWTNGRLGLASATAWTMFVIIVAAVAVNLGLARRRMRRQGAGQATVVGGRKLVTAP